MEVPWSIWPAWWHGVGLHCAVTAETGDFKARYCVLFVGPAPRPYADRALYTPTSLRNRVPYGQAHGHSVCGARRLRWIRCGKKGHKQPYHGVYPKTLHDVHAHGNTLGPAAVTLQNTCTPHCHPRLAGPCFPNLAVICKMSLAISPLRTVIKNSKIV